MVSIRAGTIVLMGNFRCSDFFVKNLAITFTNLSKYLLQNIFTTFFFTSSGYFKKSASKEIDIVI